MRLRRIIIFCALVSLFLALNACTVKEPVEACKCDSAGISAEEEAGGCPAAVKEQECRLYREKEQLLQEEERRRLEKSIEPRNIPKK